MKISREEIFGPVVPIIPFEGEEEAIRLANDTDYGLASGIQTGDLRRGLRLADRIKAGTVWINTWHKYHPNASSGGYKASGYGREQGAEALESYTQYKNGVGKLGVIMSLTKQKVVVVGGGSGMGLAIATAAHAAGADIIIASRTLDKLQKAAQGIGERTMAIVLDMTDEASIKQFFNEIGSIDHLVITASSVKTGPLKTLSSEDAFASMRSKFWGPYLCASYAQIKPTGSLTFFSGVLSRKPASGLAALCAVNAAVEGLGRALAIELAPVRVNVISPGLTDTGVYDGMPEAMRKSFFEGTSKSLPVGRIGKSEDIAEAALMLMTNGFMTGVTLDIDGGALLGAILPH